MVATALKLIISIPDRYIYITSYYYIYTCSDIVGFSSLSSQLQPKQLIDIIDHLQALIDEVLIHKDIFIMERTTDGCIATSGLDEAVANNEQTRVISPISTTDSSYGSEFDLDFETVNWKSTYTSTHDHGQKGHMKEPDLEQPSSIKKLPSAATYSAILATAALKLMSYSSRVKVPIPDNCQLQLRIALHSGPCSGGIVGLQTSAVGSSHIPQYKLFGPTIRYVSNLCHSGLALQIRISKQCRNLLVEEGGFVFERSPDFMTYDSVQPIESYWLIGKEDLKLKLPSLDCAVSLTNYDDII